MRIKEPQPFEPGREYNPGERAVYRGMVIIAERWVNPSKELLKSMQKTLVCVYIDAVVALSIKTIARRLGLNATEQAGAITK